MATDPPDETKTGAPEAEAESHVEDSATDQTETGEQGGDRIAVAPPLRGAGAPPPPIPPPTVPITHATTRQKVTLAILLAIFTVAIIGAWFYVLDQTEDQLHREYKLSWEAPRDLELRPGPPSFYYNRQTHEMFQRGPIDIKLKSELVELPIAKENENADAAIQSYNDAINNLAYRSNESLRGILILLLLFGGLSGLLGNQLRTNMNFVNIIVYKDALDVHRWWPWYAIPPFISFVLGVVVVLMIKAELLSLGDKVPSGSLGWAGLAFLAGFGASDFTERLRLLTQTLFGKSSP